MKTLTLNNSTSSIFSDIFKSNNVDYVQKVSGFLKNKNTKSNALLSYWGAETIIDGVLFFALFTTGAYVLAFLALMLAVYRSYAVLGVLSDIKHT